MKRKKNYKSSAFHSLMTGVNKLERSVLIDLPDDDDLLDSIEHQLKLEGVYK